MANLVNQPTPNPTNKLTAAIIAAAVVAILQALGDIVYPGVFDEKLWTAMFPIAVWAAGYFVKDEATVVMVQNVVEKEVEVQK
jgi:hypothetical protein